MAGFRADAVNVNGRTVVHLSGELDIATAPELSECLEGASRRGAALVVLDLADLEFCDSSGLAQIVEWHRRGARQGFSLLLHAPTPSVTRLLELTSLNQLLNVEASGTVGPRR